LDGADVVAVARHQHRHVIAVPGGAHDHVHREVHVRLLLDVVPAAGLAIHSRLVAPQHQLDPVAARDLGEEPLLGAIAVAVWVGKR
jgi:hypothetical protein